jgi:hypothetical protein
MVPHLPSLGVSLKVSQSIRITMPSGLLEVPGRALPLSCMSQVSAVGMVRMKINTIR